MGNVKKEYSDAFDLILEKLINLPKDLKYSFLFTYLVGFATHLSIYTNVYFAHDGTLAYFKVGSGTSESRFLLKYLFKALGGFQLPLAEGIITLFLYSLSAFIVCRLLKIKRVVPIFFTCAIMVTSFTATSSNMYLSSAHIYAFALFTACLAPYLVDRFKYGYIAAVPVLIISIGSYGAYFCFAASLLLLVGIRKILTKEEAATKILLWQIRNAVVLAVSLALSYATILIMARLENVALSGRVAGSGTGGISRYLTAAIDATNSTLANFSLAGYYSYFSGSAVNYFWIGLISTAAVIIYWFIAKKLYSYIPLALVHIALLPLAMNIFHIFFPTHTLMRFAFITPWLMFVAICEIFHRDYDSVSTKAKRILVFYSIIIALVCSVLVYSGWRIANIAYLKAQLNYEAAMTLTGRIIDRIEEVPNYQPSSTPVIFVGDTRAHYAPYRQELAVLDSLTGIGGPFWDTSLTYNFALFGYINQLQGIDMNIIDFEGDTSSCIAYLASNYIIENPTDLEELRQISSFPKGNCYMWVEDILVFKLSD